jgi:hypothetical protein
MSEIDYQSIVDSFDETWEPEESETVEETPEDLEDIEVEEADDVEETDEQELESDESEESELEQEQQEPDFKEDKQNKAFAELRRKAEENEKAKQFLQQLANEAGVSEEEILNRYSQRALQAEAEKNNVPVEVMQRIKTLEEENRTVKESAVAERMDKQIRATIDKYGATDEDIRATFTEMLNSGVDPRTNPNVDFEKFYKAANFDKILENKVKEAQQTSLSQKKKRQAQAAIPNGTSTTQPGTSDIDDLVSKDVQDILENW